MSGPVGSVRSGVTTVIPEAHIGAAGGPPVIRPGVGIQPEVYRNQPVHGRPGVLPEQGKPSLATLRAATPGFDFGGVRDFGGSVANTDDRGRVEMRAIGDGERQIQFEREESGTVRIRYGENAGEMRELEVTPQLRAELAQAFRMSAAIERSESQRTLAERHAAWEAHERQRAGNPHLNPSPEPTAEGIEAMYRYRMEFAEVVAGG